MGAANGSTAGGTGTRTVRLVHRAVGDPLAFTRADVVFTGVDHSGCSYEVRVFLNNPDAGVDTPLDEAHRYAGRFHVFGHGGCFGDLGHCDVPAPSSDPTDLRPAHPLTPLDTYLTVTVPLRRLLSAGVALESVSMVAISRPPRRQDRAPAPALFHYLGVELRTYLTPADEPGV